MRNNRQRLFRLNLLCGIAALLFAAAPAAAPLAAGQEEVVHESWTLTRIAGEEVGWLHEKSVKLTDGGNVRFRVETAMIMEMMRFGQTVKISMSGWSLEDEAGAVLAMQQTSQLSGNEMIYDLEVDGGQGTLTMTTMGKARPQTIPWDLEVLGPAATFRFRQSQGLEPGTQYTTKSFSFDHNKVVTTSVEIKGPDQTELLDGQSATLCRAVTTIDLMPGIETDEWLDDDCETIKTSTNLMGMLMESYRTTETRAKQTKGGGELQTDMILETMATSNVNLPNPYGLDSILYRFKAKDEKLGIPQELESFRQKVLENDGQEATVLITAKVPSKSQKRPMTAPPPELAEYLAPNSFLQSDDPALAAKAAEVVGRETDAWKAACLLENFVYRYITDKNFGTGFATASEVLENPSGDCSEHGVFLAALCRAAGIPARVAMGYMYLGGIFGGHMWAEVWIDGEWYPVDGVMGIGRVDPTHITFCTASLNDGSVGDAFVSALQGLGNLEISILEFTRGDKTIKVGKSFKDYEIDGDTYTNTLYGISITKPKGYEFDNYERDFSGVDFTLVELEGESDMDVLALPAAFSFTLASFREILEQRGWTVESETPRKVAGRNAALFKGTHDGDAHMAFAVVDQDTCFSFAIEIEDAERDEAAFDSVIKSISFAE